MRHGTVALEDVGPRGPEVNFWMNLPLSQKKKKKKDEVREVQGQQHPDE